MIGKQLFYLRILDLVDQILDILKHTYLFLEGRNLNAYSDPQTQLALKKSYTITYLQTIRLCQYLKSLILIVLFGIQLEIRKYVNVLENGIQYEFPTLRCKRFF